MRVVVDDEHAARAARPRARWNVVVDLSTPPFWLQRAMIRAVTGNTSTVLIVLLGCGARESAPHPWVGQNGVLSGSSARAAWLDGDALAAQAHAHLVGAHLRPRVPCSPLYSVTR